MNNIPPSICPDKRDDDMKSIANIVLKRMEKEFPPPQQQQQTQQNSQQGGKALTGEND